jgi:hypothetical protein
MNAEEYFAAEGTNASLLKAFREDESLFQAQHYMKEGIPGTKDLEFGRVFHGAMECHGELPDNVVELPFDDLRSNAAKEWKAGHESMGKIVMKKKDIDRLRDMISAFYPQMPLEYCEAFGDPATKREECIFAGGFKAMLDVCHYGKHEIYDYKTVRDVRPRAIRNAAATYGWYLQAYHYCMVYSLLTGTPMEDIHFRFVFVMKAAPYELSVREVGTEELAYGKDEWNKAHDRYLDCLETGVYPGYGHGPLGLPDWSATDVSGLIIDGEEVEL